ncbi:hypothetical protein [Flavobacterium davisii]|uniref:hypothetical protein n=1 Tax=Flavobacterium davisii TaxID=2906077 RepID=UPI0035D097F3
MKQINWIILSSGFLLISCKKENAISSIKNINTSTINDSITSNNSILSNETTTNSNKSFTIDCDSGCAMIYNEAYLI